MNKFIYVIEQNDVIFKKTQRLRDNLTRINPQDCESTANPIDTNFVMCVGEVDRAL